MTRWIRAGWIRAVWIVALIVLVAFPSPAQEPPEPQPFARSRLEPGPRVTVGQPVTVVVEVLVPTWFTAAPRFPGVDVTDAIAIFENRGVNFTTRIEGRTWAGQSRSYHIYPQRPGSFEIAAIAVRLGYFSDRTGPRTQVTVSPPPLRFEAIVPPEARDLPYFISTTELTVDQTFDPMPETLKIGEAFTRTITVTVRDALSMVIPPLSAVAIPGLAIYPDPPVVRDAGGERGERIVGTRVEATTYVAEEAGEYRLSAVELAWWDVDAGRLRKASAPQVEFRVLPEVALVSEIGLPADEVGAAGSVEPARPVVSLRDFLRRWGLPLAAGVLIALLVRRLGRRYGPLLRQRLKVARRRRAESEAVAFRRFKAAARSGDAPATWRQLTSWLDRVHTGPGTATVRAFVEQAADPELERQAGALGSLLFAADRTGGWSNRVLYRKVAGARRRIRSRPPRKQDLAATLNPR